MVRTISLSKGQLIFVYTAQLKNPYIEQVIRDITYKDILRFRHIFSPVIYDI